MAKNQTPCISTNPSSSQSSSIAGDIVDVKVEITPPKESEPTHLSNSYSLDSNSTMNICLNLSDFKTNTLISHPRKMSEIPQDGLLNPANYGRFTPSPSASSASKLYKKIEEMMDLSSPYNHYKCLSPSESNLTQCNENKYLYATTRIDSKPGSSRLLRRQFSLDRDDCPTTNQVFRQNLDIPTLQEHRASPTNLKSGRLLKQNSTSVALDLEKIEEIPISPTSVLSNHKVELRSSASESDSAKTSFEHNEISLNVDSLIMR